MAGYSHTVSSDNGVGKYHRINVMPNSSHCSFERKNQVVTADLDAVSFGASNSTSLGPQNATLHEDSVDFGSEEVTSLAHNRVYNYAVCNESAIGDSASPSVVIGDANETCASIPECPKVPISVRLAIHPLLVIVKRLQTSRTRFSYWTETEIVEFLKDRVLSEKAALSEGTIAKRLKTRTHISSAAISSLESSTCPGNDEQFCNICKVHYDSGDKIGLLYYCCHEFHASCLKKWLLQQNTCPVCRTIALIPAEYPGWNHGVELHRTVITAMLC